MFLKKLKAVELMHSKGIIHMDLKESNTLFDKKSGRVVILDFGSCFLENKRNESFVVTAGYTAPELDSELRNISFALDIWSVGAIFAYFVTLLESPFNFEAF